jgi:hypothetical protein
MSIQTFDNDLDAPLWGAEPMAPVIGKSVPQTHYLLSKGLLDATKVGRLYVSTKRRLLNQFAGRNTAATAA